MQRRPFAYFLLTLILGLMLFPAVVARGEVAEERGLSTPAVDSELAVRVAEAEASEKWPGSRFLSVVPYYDPSGKVTAWAVQFAKAGSAVGSEKDLAPLLAERLSAKARVLAGIEARACAAGDSRELDPRDLVTREDGATTEALGLSITVAGDVFAGARARQEQESLESEREGARRARENAARLAAIRAGNLADDVGTVVVSAREDLYPVLELHSGPAAHLKFTERVAKASGVEAGAVAKGAMVGRVIYAGPMTYWLEPTAELEKSVGAGRWLNAEDSAWIDSAAKRAGPLAKGMPGAMMDEEVGKSPAEVWAEARSSLARTGAVRLGGQRTPSHNSIEGVPFYFQDWYGRNACGPTAFATTLGYWDTQGFGTLVDNGESLHDGPGNESHLVYYCMRDTGYDPDLGTWPDWDPIESGIRKVCEDTGYANFVDVHVTERTGVSFNDDVKDYIDKGRPLTYCWFIEPNDPTSGHWSTIVGYRDNGAVKYATLHNNWEGYYPDGYELNLSNVLGTNEWCEKIRIDETPFDTPWSESWETCALTSNGSCRGAWLSWCSINGVAQPYVGWMANDLRSHSRPYSPYPEYGGLTHSGKLTPPSYEQADPYPANFDSYFVYGPFSTLGRTSGELSAMFAIEIQDWQDDGAMMVASVDGVNWGGMRIADPEGGEWFNAKLNLASVPNVGNLMNRQKVWVGFYFHSDGDANTSRGPFIDNINIILRPRVAALPKPVNVQASQGLYLSNIDVSCPAVSGATHYQFLRWTPETGAYDPITGWIVSPSFTDTARVAGTTYYYRMKCADNPSGTNASEISDRADGWVGTRAPYNFNATQGGHTDKVVLTWWDTDNDNYTVQRSVNSTTGPWENRVDGATRASLLVDASQPALFQWTDNAVSAGVNYYYRVRGTRGPTTTAYTEVQLGYTKLVTVAGITATSTATGVTLSWPGTAGRYYAVYHDTDTSGVPTRIRDFATGSSYTHTISGAAGAYHYYYVRQALDASGKALSDYGPFTNGYRINGKTTGVSASDGTNEAHVLVQWSATSGATHYEVRARNEGSTSEQVVMNWSTATSFQDTAALAGKLRTYTVKAASSSTGFASGAASDPDTGWRRLSAVQNVRATDGTRTDGVEVAWSPVSGAGAYRVSRYVGSSTVGVIVSDWLPVAVSFVDGTAQVNTVYRYRVQAAADIQGNRAGLTPNEDTGFRGFGPPAGLTASDGTRTDAVSVTWNAIPGNVLYRVSRSTAQGGVYTPVSAWLTAAAYDDTSALPTQTYWYAAEAAADASGTNGTVLGSKESGWRKLRAPASVSASDGVRGTVNVSWEAVSGAGFYDVFYSTTPTGSKSPALSRVSSTSGSFVPPNPATVYYFFVQAFVDPGTLAQQRSDFSPADSGWYSTESVSHPPNCTNAHGVISYLDGLQVQIAEVADDWTSPDGNPIQKVRWWGNYSQYSSGQSTSVLPPRGQVEGFILRLYTVAGGHPTTPGTLLREARIDNYTETWSCAVPRYDNPSLREHQYRYEADLPTAWPSTQGTSYYLAVVALMADRPPANPWCWQSADTHTGEAAYYRSALTSTTLAYPAGHPLATQPMSMAFELVSAPAATPTPSPTPTATPSPTPVATPDGKWSQELNAIDGRGHLSYTEAAPATNDVRAADDWVCPDGSPIVKVRWWGGYPGYEPGNASLVDPPEYGATAFVVSWYTATADQVPAPGTLIGQETVTDFGEVAVGTVHSRIGQQSWEYQHVYEYEASLATPWAQALNQRYFLSIQAIHPTSAHATSWGWFGAETKNLSPAHVKQDAGSDWTPQYYENYQRLWPGGIDLAFELSSEVPTATPTPSPSPTLPPSATPTATPTPTPSPTATPATMRFDRLPNLADGLSRESWRTSGARGRVGTTPVRIGDDWQTTDDRPIDRVRWWGAYTGWQSSSAAPCAPPAGHPAQFELTWSNAAVGPPYQPGAATVAAVVSAFTETWVAAVERWDAPGTYLHVFRCEATLPALWAAAPGQDYFLEVRAVYPAIPTQNAWGWVSAVESIGHGGVEQVGAAPWTELMWPAGHRLASTPMDLAFQVMAVEQLPTATPSPTPPILPTSTPSPSPTPFGWTGTQPPNTVDGIDELSYTVPDVSFDKVVADDVTFDRNVSLGTLTWWGSYPGWRADTSAAGESPASLVGLIGNLDRPKERPVAYAVRVYEPATGGAAGPGTLLSEQFLIGWQEEWAAAVPRFGHAGQWEHEYRFTAPLEAPLVIASGTRRFVSIQAIYADADPAYLWGWLGSAESHGSSAFTRTGTGPWSALDWPAGHRLAAQGRDMAFELREGVVPTPTLTPSPTPTPVTTPSPTPAGWYALTVSGDHGTVGRDPDQAAYAPGSTVLLVAKGDDGYAFAAWAGELGTGQADDNPLTVTMNAPRTLEATFVVTPFTLAATIDSGTLSVEPQQASYLYGTVVTVEALPSAGQGFDRWEMTGGELSETELLANPISFPMRGDVTLRAVTSTPTSHWLLY